MAAIDRIRTGADRGSGCDGSGRNREGRCGCAQVVISVGSASRSDRIGAGV